MTNVVTTRLKIKEIKPNPDNPRVIKSADFKKLVKSLKDFPEMIEAREIVVNTDHVILGSNMRYRAAIEAGATELPVKVVDWDEAKQREFIIKDNVSNGDWDWEALANKWDADKLDEWGCDVKNWDNSSTFSDTVEKSSQGSVRDYSEDTNYDLKKTVRRRINPEIVNDLERGIKNGKIRPEIAEIMRTRINQCVIFNFDEIIKFYRSEDATEEERDLLRRLYLVFITAKEAFERHMLELNTITSEIVDRKLMEQKTDETD